MTVGFIIDTIKQENPNAKIALQMFNGLPVKKDYFVPVEKAKEVFSGWLKEEVRTMYNGTFYSNTDRSSAENYYTEKDLVVLVYWGS